MQIFKDLAEIAQGFGVLLAAFIGGAWTFFLWRAHGEKNARLEVAHDVNITRLPDARIFVRLALSMKNIGKVPVNLDKGFVSAQQILPNENTFLTELAAKPGGQYPKFEWEEIGRRSKDNWGIVIEAGEPEITYFDFLFPKELEKFSLYSHFTDQPDSEKDVSGWTLTTMHDVPE